MLQRGRRSFTPRSKSSGRAGDCGGRDYYWGHDTPWSDTNCPAKATDNIDSAACFLKAQDEWLPTWGEDSSMLVDWVRVWELPEEELAQF